MNAKISKERLRKLIDDKGIMQKDFAELCNCSPVTLSKILTGKLELSEKMAQRFAPTLNVSVDYLLAKTDDPLPAYHDQFLSQNAQWRKINELLDYLKCLDIYFERRLFLDTELYVWKNNAFISQMHPDKEYSKMEMINLIKNSNFKKISQKVNLSYQGSYREISSEEFLSLMNNFHKIAQSYFFTAIGNFKDFSVVTIPDEIDRLINELTTSE